jgi:lipopolysaccharide biosynthesis glycosyltransferase
MVFYTCCTLNHLAQAKVLGKSIKSNHPDDRDIFLIFLADKINHRVHSNYIDPFEIVEITEKNCSNLSQLIKKYDAFELVCYMKSHAALMLCSRYPGEKIVYLDTDIAVFNSFELIDNILNGQSFIITPHILQPATFECKIPEEREFLNSGIYNAGFFAFKANTKAILILQWLNTRLEQYCKVNASKGLFVDQIWFNHIPVLFHEDTLVLRDKGYNMAYWNLGERSLFKKDNTYLVADGSSFEKLVFYHFSGYNFMKPDLLSEHQNKYSFDSQPVLKELFDFYSKQLIENDHPKLLKNTCLYYSNGVSKLFKVFK